MNTITPIIDLPSPSSSYQYMYADSDQYFDARTSDSQSPINSHYDLSYVQDFGVGDVYPSPEREPDSPQDSTNPSTKTPAKRKRENRYKNAPPSVLSRRRAQNRASQRAYRERKDQRIKDLEQMLNESKQRNDVLSQAYTNLHSEYVKLKTQQLTDPTYGGGAAFDPASVALVGGPRGLEMDVYGYPDLTAYAHM